MAEVLVLSLELLGGSENFRRWGLGQKVRRGVWPPVGGHPRHFLSPSYVLLPCHDCFLCHMTPHDALLYHRPDNEGATDHGLTPLKL